MKFCILLLLCMYVLTATAQSSAELIGKWKLIKETKNGKDKTPKDAYQVFMEGGKFQGINGDKSKTGKWTLSDNKKELTIKISVVSVKFNVDYFDAKKRIISSEVTGTLEYEKVSD